MERINDNIDNNDLNIEDFHILKYDHEELEALLNKIDKGFMITEEQYQALLDRGYFGGDYNDLSNKPVIPTDTSDLTNYANFVTQNDLTAELNRFFTQLVTEEIGDQIEKAIKALDFTDLDIGDLNDSQGLLIPMDIIQNAINGAIGALQGVTKLSQLINDCDFVDEEGLEERIDYVVEQIENLFIPTHVSHLIDDSGHITKTDCEELLRQLHEWILSYVPDFVNQTLAKKNYADKLYVDTTIATNLNYLESYLQAQINNKADKLDLAELKQWVHNRNYLTKNDIINGYLGGQLSEVSFTKKYEEMLREASKMAVCKINIDSDIRLAMTAAVRKHLVEHPDHFDPRQYLTAARTAVKDVVAHKMQYVLGCSGKL